MKPFLINLLGIGYEYGTVHTGDQTDTTGARRKRLPLFLHGRVEILIGRGDTWIEINEDWWKNFQPVKE